MTDSVVIDDVNELLYFGKEKPKITPIYYKFDEIADYEYKKFGGTVITKSKGGLGRALVGGAMFGGVGAIVGANTCKTETKVVGEKGYLIVNIINHSGKHANFIDKLPYGLIPFLDKCIDESKKTHPTQPVMQMKS